MTDVSDLCHRVILIDKGQIRFDGQLTELTSQFTQEKILKFSFFKNVPQKIIQKYGEIVEHNLISYTIKVPKKKYLQVASSILSTLPVIDLNIEDIPIEDVIRQVYSHR
jgi:ABC-2 type transport system ATP-binding protein